MKVIRAPLRISLFGGGTDLDPFVTEHGSTIISLAINRYMYLTWNPRPTGGCRLSYSKVEELESLKDAQHTLVRETARTHGIDEPCTLTIVSDMPKGTGLGSSSALAAALVIIARRFVWDICWLVRKAASIEGAHSKAGWQDYLPAVYGGLNTYSITDSFSKSPLSPFDIETCLEGDLLLGVSALPTYLSTIIHRYGLLLYTGTSRPADSILSSWKKSEAQLHEIKALADTVASEINNITPERLGHYLDQTWELKRSIPGVTSPSLNRQYAVAMANGALGGKLLGAGAGGCWFFLVPPISTTRAKIKQALGLREIPFKIAEKGVESWEL